MDVCKLRQNRTEQNSTGQIYWTIYHKNNAEKKRIVQNYATEGFEIHLEYNEDTLIIVFADPRRAGSWTEFTIHPSIFLLLQSHRHHPAQSWTSG